MTGVILPDIQAAQIDTELDRIVLTPQEVQSVIKILPLGKASGPNIFNNRILRELSSQVSAPYCSLFNQLLRLGLFPNSYKEANVCPMPIKGDLSLVTNYRPISLLNSESKLFERLVFKHLFNHVSFQGNILLTSLQSGFIPGDSTVNQLTFLYNTFCQALDSGKEVRAVFCDISKAFDRVWHRGLIYKLKAAGVTEEVLFGLQIILLIESKGSLFQALPPIMCTYKQVFPGAQLLGLCFFYYISMTLLMILVQISDSLLTILAYTSLSRLQQLQLLVSTQT